jgi:hypothetical protein
MPRATVRHLAAPWRDATHCDVKLGGSLAGNDPPALASLGHLRAAVAVGAAALVIASFALVALFAARRERPGKASHSPTTTLAESPR